MLILGRKLNQSVVISHPGIPGGQMVVKVIAIGSTIRLGFEAQGNVQIHREEVHNRLESGGRDVAVA